MAAKVRRFWLRSATWSWCSAALRLYRGILVETTELDAVYAVVRAWMAANFRTEEAVVRLSAPAETHWNSRLFTADLAPGLKIGLLAVGEPAARTAGRR